MRRLITLALATVLVATAGVSTSTASPTRVTAPTVQTASLPAEDSPRFDCRIHGNHVCAVFLDPKPNDRNRTELKYLVDFDTMEFRDARYWRAPKYASGSLTPIRVR